MCQTQTTCNRVKLPDSFSFASRERGIALVMALAILLILTILGVAAMSTTSLQEKMSGNVQEQTKAFQAAESGLTKINTTAGALVLAGAGPPPHNDFTFGNTTANVIVNYKQSVPPKRGSGYSATNFSAANFDQQSTGQTVTGAKAVIHGGVAQIVPK
jgi:PilX N-terminal